MFADGAFDCFFAGHPDRVVLSPNFVKLEMKLWKGSFAKGDACIVHMVVFMERISPSGGLVFNRCCGQQPSRSFV